jgi:hypothetical protein
LMIHIKLFVQKRMPVHLTADKGYKFAVLCHPGLQLTPAAWDRLWRRERGNSMPFRYW